MLQNTGPYGPNDAPMSMGGAVNMSQMTPNANFNQNLSNMGKIAQQTAEQPTPQYHFPDYSIYNNTPLNIGQQMGSFPNYHPANSHPNFTPPTSSAFHDTSWQNGFFPMNLNAQAHHGHNMLNYSLNFEKKPTIPAMSNDFFDTQVHGKSLPINIPQVPTKAFQKFHNEDYNSLNSEKERYNNVFHRTFEETPEYIPEHIPEKPLMDSSKRKSLENTVRLIEDLLINTTKNKELELEKSLEQKGKEIKDSSKTVHCDITYPKTNNTILHDILTKTKSNKTIDKETKHVSNCNLNKQDTFEEKKTNETDNKKERTKSDNKDSNVEESYIKNEVHSPETHEEIESVDIKPILNTVFVKIDVEGEQSVDVKVENCYWTDTDYSNPFHRDINGIQRDEMSCLDVVDSEVSIQEAIRDAKEGLKTDKYYECPHCTLLFSHPKRFLIHTKWHTFGLINERRTVFAKEREIWRNQRREARVVNRMNAKEVTDKLEGGTGENVFPCKDCDKAFTSKSSLKNHKQRYHPTRIRECKICGLSVVGWMALRNHVASHGTTSSFPCTDCHKVFKHAHSLAKHRDTHLEKTVSCELCPKKFGTHAQLKMHQKVHERAQRGATYQCSYCAKSFYEAYNLGVHERTHRNERPFECQICHTTYGTNSGLKRHLKVSHSTDKPYQCPICKRNFISERIRDRHCARVHAQPEDFQYKCTQCSSKFLKSKDLQKHIYNTHPKNSRRRKSKKEIEEPSSSWEEREQSE